MDDDLDDRPIPPGPRQVLRLVLPAFVVSTLVIVVGIVLSLNHHRTLGLVFVVVGAVGGFGVRTKLMLRAQQGGGRPRR